MQYVSGAVEGVSREIKRWVVFFFSDFLLVFESVEIPVDGHFHDYLLQGEWFAIALDPLICLVRVKDILCFNHPQLIAACDVSVEDGSGSGFVRGLIDCWHEGQRCIAEVVEFGAVKGCAKELFGSGTIVGGYVYMNDLFLRIADLRFVPHRFPVQGKSDWWFRFGNAYGIKDFAKKFA